MSDAMVTARMSLSKKEAGGKLLRDWGYTASQAINELYDRMLETGEWPLAEKRPGHVGRGELKAALAFVDGIAQVPHDEFVNMDLDSAKRQRLISKGRATEEDFR